MNIRDIKKQLIGRTIKWFDGFSGSSDWFIIGHIEVSGSSIRVRAAKDKGWGVFIPKAAIETLLNSRSYEKKGSLEGCAFTEKWSIA